jgi:transcriptional regulator with XRE-family HTH domain
MGTRKRRWREFTPEERHAVGRVVATSRLDAGLTQEALAGRLGWGISRSRLGRIERSEIEASKAELLQIARALRLKPTRLFERIVSWPEEHQVNVDHCGAAESRDLLLSRDTANVKRILARK